MVQNRKQPTGVESTRRPVDTGGPATVAGAAGATLGPARNRRSLCSPKVGGRCRSSPCSWPATIRTA